jgi:hypothetical protein
MPAIRPARLKRETEELQGLVGDPSALRWRVVDLLEFYADRTKRYGMSERIGDATVRFHVPTPVIQALKSALVGATKQDPDGSLAIAEELWAVEVQEARLLAISVLANAPPDDSIAKIPVWAKASRDSRVLDALANTAYRGLVSQGDENLRDQVGKWLLSRNDPLQKLGIYTLKAAASDDQTDRVHTVFETLLTVGFRKSLISRPGYAPLLEFLILKNPSETAGYLLQGLRRGRGNIKQLVRELIHHFPASQRRRLESEISF